MRISLAAGVFSIAVLAAACGGGGGNSGAIPTVGKPVGTGPVSAAKTAAAVVLHIPRASAQSRAHKPFIITAATKSVVITVVPVGATPTATDWQVFPVTTPTPCQLASDGTETCTFVVQALFGNDTITISTYAVANPGPNDVALASATGPLVVSRTSNGATPPPLNLTLNQVVTSVAVTVPSPEPSNTPNTQVFTVGVAQSPLPLGLTAYDASGAIVLSGDFSSPVPINVTPANAGVTLAIKGTCANSSGGGNTVSIGCSADLANVTFAYDGSVSLDANDNIADAFTIASALVASPAPTPARVVLQSNVQTYVPNTGGNTLYYKVFLQALPNNAIGYMLSGDGATASYGTLNAVTGAFSAPTSLAIGYPNAFYTMSDGSIWVTEANVGTLQCFTAAGGNKPITTVPMNANEYPTAITFDGTKLWWGTYAYTPSAQNYAYSAPLTAPCTLGSSTQHMLPTTYQDSLMFFAALPGGGMAINGTGTGDFWTVSSNGAVSSVNPGFNSNSGYGGGVATDGSGKTYAAFNNYSHSYISVLSGGSLTQLMPLLTARAEGELAAFGPNNALADRIAYANTDDYTFDMVEGLNGATPLIVPVTIGNSYFQASQNVAMSTSGSAFIGYENESGTPAPMIARPLLTTTWSVAMGTTSVSDVLSIDERGDSGPFTVTTVGTNPPCYSGIIAPISGTDHAFHIGTFGGNAPCPITVQVTDKNGRTQVLLLSVAQNNS